MANWSDIEHAAGDTNYITHLNTLVSRSEAVASQVEDLLGGIPAMDNERSLSTATTLVAADDRARLLLTGTWTLGVAEAETLGAGWRVELVNVGTGIITLDPYSSETLDDVASFVMYPGEWRRVWFTGTALKSFVIRPFDVRFLSSGTFIKPSGYRQFSGLLWGGGGSGAAAATASGGGGGGCTPFTLESSALAATETVTLGTGGAAKTASNTGAVGGNSTLGSLVTAYGGGGGFTSSTTAGGGGLYSAGTASAGGAPGGATTAATASVYGGGLGSGGDSGQSVYGGGWKTVYGGASGGVSTGTAGGTSVYGGAGGAGGTNGVAGTQPGGGGGGGTSTSGAGARGALRIWGVV